MEAPGKYLYCIIRCQEDRAFDEVAIGDEGSPVHTVCCGGLAAVVSDTAMKRYESTRKNMVAHEKVLERILQEHTLLPVRFGTVADSTSPTQSILRLLRDRYAEFDGLLKEMQDVVELGLKVFWRDERAIFDEVVAENADIRRLRDSLLGRPPEATHFDRMRLGEKTKEALDRKRAQQAGEILSPLRRLASDVRENEVLIDRVVVNAAFLVHKAQEPEFDRTVSRLEEQFGVRVALKYVGPTPPYNFVNIVVNWGQPE